MNPIDQTKMVLNDAESRISRIAYQYAKDVIYPFCDKYDLTFIHLVGRGRYFYFRDAEIKGKYQYSLDYMMGMNPERLEYIKPEDKDSLLSMPAEFWEQLKEISDVIDNVVVGYSNISAVLGKYIPTYPAD